MLPSRWFLFVFVFFLLEPWWPPSCSMKCLFLGCPPLQDQFETKLGAAPALPPRFCACPQKCWVAGGLGRDDASYVAKSHRREEEKGEGNLHKEVWIPFPQSSTNSNLFYTLEQKGGISSFYLFCLILRHSGLFVGWTDVYDADGWVGKKTACLPASTFFFVSGSTLHYISAAWYAHVTSTFYCHKTLPLPQTNHEAEESGREQWKGNLRCWTAGVNL